MSFPKSEKSLTISNIPVDRRENVRIENFSLGELQTKRLLFTNANSIFRGEHSVMLQSDAQIV